MHAKDSFVAVIADTEATSHNSPTALEVNVSNQLKLALIKWTINSAEPLFLDSVYDPTA